MMPSHGASQGGDLNEAAFAAVQRVMTMAATTEPQDDRFHQTSGKDPLAARARWARAIISERNSKVIYVNLPAAGGWSEGGTGGEKTTANVEMSDDGKIVSVTLVNPGPPGDWKDRW